MSLRSTQHLFLLGAIASALAACGGSSTPSTAPALAPAALTLAADASAVDWNTSSNIDVLSNDTVTRGGMTLTAVSGAAHGTAIVSNGKINYTPTAGFYGVENLSYTVTATEGGATATGTAAVTVEALLTLNGNASDNPLSNATVAATVGGKTFTATTKANGDFSLVLRSTKGTDFVVLTATGSGGQAPVKLTSLVGDIADLAKDANAQGQVAMADSPNIAVTHITTAFMALATKSLGGTAPTTLQQLEDVASKVDVDEVMRLATAIKLIADAGVPLPAGITDTLALVQSDAAVAAVYTAATAINPLLAAATRDSVEDQAVSPGPAFTLDGRVDRTVVYRDFTVQYRKDGTARMSGRMGERNMTWVATGPNVTLTYQQPVEFYYDAGTLKANGVATQYAIKEVANGMLIMRVLNENTVRWGETGSVTWVDGPDAGKAATGINVTTTNKTESLSSSFNLDERLPITAAMTAPGVVLGGAVSIPSPTVDSVSNPGTGFLDFVPQRIDALEFVDATTARFVLSQRLVTYEVSDNFITIHHQSGNAATWRFALLGINATSGTQTWVAQDTADGLLVPFTGQVSDAPKLKFTEELALHRFVEGPTSVRLTGQLNADKTVTSTLYPGPTYTSSWEVTLSGDLVIRHVTTATGKVARSTRFVPIKFVGKKLWYVAVLNANSSIISYLEDQN